MPDVFIADEKETNDDVVLRKRNPLPSTSSAETPESPAAAAKNPTGEIILETPISNPEQIEPREDVEIVKENYEEKQPEEYSASPSKEEHSSEILVDDKERRNGIPLFTSFWQNPQGVYFDTQEANEHILLFLRRHFITNFPWIFTTLAFAVLPIIIGYLIKITNFSLALFPPAFVTTSLVMYYLIVITGAFLRFLDWYFNISLITARRVMDIELKDLVYKKISATKISLVQDVNYQQAGTIRSIFNYGDVLVQTAGATDNFFVNAIPKPEVVVQVMEELIGKGAEEKEDATV